MFYPTDTEEVTRMKCVLINNEMTRIHKTIHDYDYPESKYKLMLEAFKHTFTKIEECWRCK